MTWDGRQAGPDLFSGNTVLTTDGSGFATIPFGVTFPREPHVVAMGGNSEQVSITYGTGAITTTSFKAQFKNGSGTVLANSPVRCIWIARCSQA